MSRKKSFFYLAVQTIFGSLSLRSSLLIIIFIPLLGVLASSWFSFEAGKQEIENLVDQVSEKSTDIIEENVRNYLIPPQISMLSQLAAIQSGDLKIDEFSQLQRSFGYQLQQQKVLNTLYFASESGNFLMIEKDGNNWILKIKDKGTENRRNIYQLDSQWNRVKLVKSVPYDPRLRPWYQIAKKTEKLTWSPIYQDSTKQSLMISLVMPILEPKTGNFQGTLGTDLSLQVISDFLRNLSISATGKAFILERSGNLVATSTQEEPFQIVEGKQERLKVTQSQEPVIQAIDQYLIKKFNSLEAIESKEEFSLTFRGDSHFVQVSPLQDKLGLNWLLVVVIPKADFTKHIYGYTRFTIILGLFTITGTIILGLLMIGWINQPIQALYQAAKAIESEKFDESTLEQVASRRDEFGALGKVFLAMAQVISSREENLKKMLNQLQQKSTDENFHNSRDLEILQKQVYDWKNLLKKSQKIRTNFESLSESQIVPNQSRIIEVNSQVELKE